MAAGVFPSMGITKPTKVSALNALMIASPVMIIQTVLAAILVYFENLVERAASPSTGTMKPTKQSAPSAPTTVSPAITMQTVLPAIQAPSEN